VAIRFFENWNRFYDPVAGRYTASDPYLRNAKAELAGVYSYALNNPIWRTDLSGLLPGDIYDTEEQAVMESLGYTLPLVARTHVEWGCSVYANKGGVSYTEPNRGEVLTVEPSLPPDSKPGLAFTHGQPLHYSITSLPDTKPEVLSPEDKQYSEANAAPMYAVTPTGKVLLYVPKGGMSWRDRLRALDDENVFPGYTVDYGQQIPVPASEPSKLGGPDDK
jgi:hypothetical protein